DSTQEARNLALLLRAGALAAPIDIIEERTVGPSLGAENIQRGFHSIWVGFAAIAVFMIIYYLVFGLTAVVALGVNVIMLIALLSLIQATLTLPGLAGIALTVGMAIDANVLINERVREELRNGNSPQASIHAGYERAFGTILDTNVTTLIAGLALFIFGSGPIRGFAVVLCLGILTSMFSAVMVSRSLVNLHYGSRRRLARIAIGNTEWK
ncbi:MAG: protein translocase subunit SecD, partial [Gammaproteobacteria bacterium]